MVYSLGTRAFSRANKAGSTETGSWACREETEKVAKTSNALNRNKNRKISVIQSV